MGKDIINVAVIGVGYWGKNLVRNYHELGVLSTICDVNSNVLNPIKARYPTVKTTSDFNCKTKYCYFYRMRSTRVSFIV